jgi:AraC family transcriptional regulator
MQMMTIELELQTRAATAQIARYSVGAVDQVLCDEAANRLNLALTPRPRNTRARLCGKWAAHRFEPVGRLFMQPVGEAFQFRTDGGSQDSLICKFQPGWAREWLGQDLEISNRVLDAALDLPSANIRGLMERLAEEMRRPGFASEVMTELLAGQIIVELGRYCVSAADGPVGGGLPPWRLRIIEERLAELGVPPTLEELGRLCGISVRQLTRVYRATRGCSLGRFMAERRIESAKQLLASGQSVKAVAAAVGFATASSFAYAFHRAVGVTPRRYREGRVRFDA